MVVETEDFVVKVKGGVASFAYNRRFDSLEDLRMIVISAETGAVSSPVFTATGSPLEGATLTPADPILLADDVVIWRETARRQLTEYSSGNFPSAAHEDMADRLVMMLQERAEADGRSLRLEFGSPPIKAIVPKPDAVVMFNADGDPVTGPSAADVEFAQANAEQAEAARVLAETAAALASIDAADAGAAAAAAGSYEAASAANLLALGEALVNGISAFSVDAEGDLIVSYNSAIISEIQISEGGDLLISYEA